MASTVDFCCQFGVIICASQLSVSVDAGAIPVLFIHLNFYSFGGTQ